MKSSALALTAVLFFASCGDSRQEVRVVPDALGVRRTSQTFRLDRDRKPVGKPLEQQDEHFESRPRSESAPLAFHLRLSSPFGSVREYAELVKRGADAVDRVARLQQASDELIDFVLAWFGSELGTEPYWPRWRAFIDDEVRKQVKTVALILWARSVQSTDSLSQMMEILATLQLWASDQVMVQPAELAAICSSWNAGGNKLSAALQERVGLTPLPPALEFVLSHKAVADSLERFARLPEWKSLHDRWRASGSPAAEQEQPQEAFHALAFELTPLIQIVWGLRSVQVQQVCSGELLATNGAFDAAGGVINFGPALVDGGPPQTCFSMWAEPDESWQKAHFGRVILRGMDLGEYNFWYVGLDEVQRNVWDELLESVVPEEGQVHDIGFTGAAGLTSQQHEALQEGRRMLIQALAKD